MKAEFAGQTARDADNPAGNPSRLINGYREPMVPGGRSGSVLRAVPGMGEFVDINRAFMRSLATYDGNLLAIVADSLYQITPAGVVTLVGNLGAADNICGIDVSTGKAVIVANRGYFYWDGTTLVNLTTGAGTGAVTDPASVAVLGGYAVVSQFEGRVFAWSNLADPTVFDGLDFASAEITNGPIIRIIAFKDALYIFKAKGYERWAVTGLAGPDAFQRIGGALEEPGLAAYNLITTFPNGFAYVGTDGRFYVSGIGPISTPPLEVALSRLSPGRVFYYEQRGHGFICITFLDAPAWCYDTATGEWHERAQADGPWDARDTVRIGPTWYVGTNTGKIARFSSTCTDFGEPMVRRYISRTLEPLQRVRISSVEAFPRLGVDIQGDGDLSEAKVTLRMSRDGIEFGPPKDRSVGGPGAYDQRLVWRELGQFRKATAELSISSVTDIPLLAEVDLVVT